MAGWKICWVIESSILVDLTQENLEGLMKSLIDSILVAITSLFLASSWVSASEIIKGQCGAEVALVPSYGERPNTPGTIILKRRGPDGSTGWTPPLTVQPGSAGQFRWWCRSATDDTLVPGIWRVKELVVGTKCGVKTDGSLTNCHPDSSIKIDSSAWNDWIPGHSQCSSRSMKIRARLGPNRLLEIICLS